MSMPTRNVDTQIAGFPGSLLLAATMEPKEIGQRLKSAREAKGWTQLSFAIEANVSPSSVSRWERGELPTVRELVRLAELLDVAPAALVESKATGEERLVRLEERVEESLGLLEEIRRILEQREVQQADGEDESSATPQGQ